MGRHPRRPAPAGRGHGAGSRSHPRAAALCWRLGAGSRQGTSSAAKAGAGWEQPGGLRQPSAGRAGGGAGHTQQRARGGRQHRLSPQAPSLASRDARQSLAISPESLPHICTHIGVLGGPQRGWGGTTREGRALDSPVPCIRAVAGNGRWGPLQAALCLARSLQAAWGREGGSCQHCRVGGHVPCRTTEGHQGRAFAFPAQPGAAPGSISRNVRGQGDVG